MKIRRVRRGFTTNSSASSEWLPPTSTSTAGRTGVATSSQVATVSSQTQATAPVEVQAREQVARDANFLRIGGLVAFVAVAFVIERSIRFFRRKSQDKRDI